MKKQDPIISWKPPKLRKGFGGAVDILAGPGATIAELWLQFGFAFGAALIVLYLNAQNGWNFTGFQLFVAAYLAFDICGGIATNATSTAKRWWHRAERRNFKNDAKFIAAHFYMPLLVTLAFLPGDWTFFWISYLDLLAMAFLIAIVPVYLKRPVAFVMYSFAILLCLYYLAPMLPSQMQWFPFFFYLKLLMSHLPIEAPFRPENE